MSNDMPLCKCGCGTPVEKKSKKYFSDHFRNPSKKEMKVEKSKPAEKKVIEKKIVQTKKVIVPKSEKLPTKPIPGGKVSKENLRNVGLGIYVS